MANTADKVINIALNEEGYLEKSKAAYLKNPAVLDKKTEGAGSDNYTKYGRDMHKIYPAVMDFPAYWCDCFVDWCFYMAYGITTAKSLLGGNFDDYTVASATMYQKKNALDAIPLYGSQVFFTNNGKVSGCHHTGLVYKVDNTYFYTIEGNTSSGTAVVRNGGSVAKKKYSIANYKNRVLFGHPKYDVEINTGKENFNTDSDTSQNVVLFPTCSPASGGLVAGLSAIGVNYSMAYRKKIAAANGIKDYSGTAEQNDKLFSLLKTGKLINPQGTSVSNYFKKYTGKSTSIVIALAELNIDSSMNYRKKIAAANNITGYSGTAEQNTEMLGLLKKGKLLIP